jgi:hypothetical protein
MAPETESPAPTKPAKMARGNRIERMIARSVSVPPPSKFRMDWKRIWIERGNETLTLPTVMERRMIKHRRRLRRVEMRKTFFRVTIFI